MILHNTYRWLDKNRGRIRTAIGMAWPSVLESFFVALAGMVDTMMVSSIGAYAVAAVGLTTQPKFIGLALFIATNVSVSALVARRKGEMDAYGANETLLTALVFTAIAGTWSARFACIWRIPLSACAAQGRTPTRERCCISASSWAA